MSSIYNFKTEKFEEWEESLPHSWEDYIPQDKICQGLYAVCIHLGKSPKDAAEEVLWSLLGETKNE